MAAPHRQKTESARQNWRTPLALFLGIQEQFGTPFVLDAAASDDNSLCALWYDGSSEWADGTLAPWEDGTWCNPPFDRTADFILKAIAEAQRGVRSCVLLTASTENKYWLPAIESPNTHAIIFLTGRVPFIHPTTGKPVSGNPAGSALMFFGPASTGAVVKWIRRDDLIALGKKILDSHETAA